MEKAMSPLFFLVGFVSILVIGPVHADEYDHDLYSSSSVAHEKRLPRGRNSTLFALELGTQAPLWAGLSGRLFFEKHFAIEAGIGFMPSPYASMIGQTASYYMHSNAYRLLIENGFQSSRVFQLGARYQMTGEYGWHIGANSYFFRSQGSISLDQVLMSQGISPGSIGGYGSYLAMYSNADIVLLGASLGYTWKLDENWGVDASLGIAKIISTSLRLNTSIAQFDQSQMGQIVLGQASNQVQQMLNAYGITPLLALNVQYVF